MKDVLIPSVVLMELPYEREFVLQVVRSSAMDTFVCEQANKILVSLENIQKVKVFEDCGTTNVKVKIVCK